MDRGFSRGLSRPIADLMHTILSAQAGTQPEQWVCQALREARMPPRISDSTKELMLRVMLNPTLLKRKRLYYAMVGDMCRVIGGELPGEDLGIYVR